jgi:hypothetical protein
VLVYRGLLLEKLKKTIPQLGKLGFNIKGHKESASFEDEAFLIIKEVASSVKQWRTVAAKLGLSKQECDRMSSAFVY